MDGSYSSLIEQDGKEAVDKYFDKFNSLKNHTSMLMALIFAYPIGW